MSRGVLLAGLFLVATLLLPPALKAQGPELTVEPQAFPQGACLAYRATGFEPAEAVGLWFTRPDGSASAEGLPAVVRADNDGILIGSFCPPGTGATGRYALTAQGRVSARTAVVHFQLLPGDPLGVPAGGAVLFADPPRATVGQLVDLVGGGFQPGETLSLWLTLPDGSVRELDGGRTRDGTFLLPLDLAGLPPGSHGISAYGQRSRLRAVAPLEVLANP